MPVNRLESYKTMNPAEAKERQEKLRGQVALEELDEEPELIAGADISFSRRSPVMHAAIVVLRLPDLEPVARSLFTDETPFPYIPGLLAFRELPVLLSAWQQLDIKPDVLILDGHGLAHPRRMGVATHFGIEIDWPTIGCAKNILTGTHGDLPPEKGARTPLLDGEEQVGITLRSRTNINPIYISPGHRVGFDDVYSVIMQSLGRYKLPETTRYAHRWANNLRKGECEPGCYSF